MKMNTEETKNTTRDIRLVVKDFLEVQDELTEKVSRFNYILVHSGSLNELKELKIRLKILKSYKVTLLNELRELVI